MLPFICLFFVLPARFEPCIHFLDLGGLLSELRRQSSHSFLLHFAVLFEDFFQQHRIHLIVAHFLYML